MRKKYRHQSMCAYIIHIRGGNNNLGVVQPSMKDKKAHERCQIWLGAHDFWTQMTIAGGTS